MWSHKKEAPPSSMGNGVIETRLFLTHTQSPLSTNSKGMSFSTFFQHSTHQQQQLPTGLSLSLSVYKSNEFLTQMKPHPPSMDWFTWLSKTSLHHSLVHEYSSTFANNELEEDDITYFDHEFLQSMGISIAKHRLLIITLARKQKPSISHSLRKFMSNTKKRFIKYIRKVIQRNSSSALTILPAGGMTRGRTMLKRSQGNKMIMKHPEKKSLMLTNGSATAGCSTGNSTATSTPMRVIPGGIPAILSSATSALMCYEQFGGDEEEDDDGYWSDQHQQQQGSIKWDAMFQDLKPT